MYFTAFQWSSLIVKTCSQEVCIVLETVGSSRSGSQVLCIVGSGSGSQAELAPWVELAPACLEQSDKLNATPTNTPLLLLYHPSLAFSNYFLRWKPPFLSRPAPTHNGYKGPPVSARSQMDFPKFPNGFLGRPIVISSPQFSRARFLALRQDGGR